MTTITPDPGVIWFAGIGFRPAVWTPPHRADGVDPDRLAPAPDADLAYLAKWEAPSDAYVWGTWLPQPDTPGAQLTAAELAGPIAGTSFSAGPIIPGPWYPPVDYPCNCITPDSPDLPPVAPVPLEASGLFLLTGLAVLWLWRRK